MRRAHCALAVGIALAAFPVAGQGNPDAAARGCGSQPRGPVLAVFVRVMTQGLETLNGLKATDFVLTENGLPQTICDFAHDRRPLSMGILLDTSGSMRGARRDLLAIAKTGINTFLDTSGPQDEYFLEYVNAAPAMQCGFTSDLPQIRARLETTPKGKTAVVDAVHLALIGMRKARHANRALLIFSDAYDNQSTRRIEGLMADFSAWPLPTFLVVPVDPWHTEEQLPEEVSARRDLIRFAGRTGGHATWVSSRKEASKAAAQLASAIRSPYVICYVSQAPVVPPRPLDLQVNVIGARGRPMVLYRGAIRLAQ